MEDDYQQPHEKSIWRKIGDFALNALIAVAAILAVVSFTAVFSDTVSNKLDKWTEDKDGKGGWGSWLRQKAGVSVEPDTSVTEKLSQMKDKAINKGKELYNKGKNLFSSNTPAENQGATPPANNSPSNNPPANDQPSADKQKEGLGISDAGAAALLLYGGKKAYNRLNPRVHVDEAGNIHSVPADQVKVEKAVEQATKDLEKAKLAQQEAQLAADKAKILKLAEDEKNKNKKWFQRGDKTANKVYTKAAKTLEAANESVTNLTGVIEDGNKVISTGKPSNNSRLRAYMGKLFGGGAGASVTGETEFGTIEPTTAKQQTSQAPAATHPGKTGSHVIDTGVDAGEAGKITATNPNAANTQPSAAVQKPAINVEKSTEFGDITPTNTVQKPPAAPAPAPQDLTIKVGKTGLVEFGNATSLSEAGKASASLSETLNSIRAGGGRLLTTIGSYLSPAKVAGPLGAAGVIIEDGARLHEGSNHRDLEGNLDQKAISTAQAIGTGSEMAGIIRGANPYALVGGATVKDLIYVGTTIATGDPNATSKGFISNSIEKGLELTGLDSVLDSTIGPKFVKPLSAEEKQKKLSEDSRQDNINAKIMELSKTDLDHTKAQEQEAMLNARQAAVEAWRQKAAVKGLDKIDPLGLVEHVAKHNWEMPPQTPRESLPPRDTQKQ